MLLWLATVSMLGAWDDFEPHQAVEARRPTAQEVAEAYDDVEKAIAAWESERKAFLADQRALTAALSKAARSLEAPAPIAKTKPLDPKVQAQLDAAEARAADLRLRCREAPSSCGETVPVREEPRREPVPQAGPQAQAAPDEDATVDAQAEARRKALEAQKRALDARLRSNDAAVRGAIDGLSGN